MSTGGSGGDAGITYVLKAIADPGAKKAFDELIGYHKSVATAQTRIADQVASHREATLRKVQAAESKALAATLRETERLNDAQRSRARAVTETQIAEIQKVTRERQAAADRGIRAISKVAEHIALSEKKAADAAINESKRAAEQVSAERQRGIDRLFSGLSRVAARVAIEEKKQADVAIREAERAARAKDGLARRYTHTTFTAGDPATHAAYVAQQRDEQERLRAEQARRADARMRFEAIRQSEMEAARRSRRGGALDTADPERAAEATRALERAQERLAARVQSGAQGLASFIGGFAELGIAGEKNTEKLLRGLIKINAAVDLFSGGVTLIRSIVSGYDAWTRSTLAAAAAHEALAASRAHAGVAGGAAAAGSVAAGGAASLAAATTALVAAAAAIVGAGVIAIEHFDGGVNVFSGDGKGLSTSARGKGLSGATSGIGQWSGEKLARLNRFFGSRSEYSAPYRESIESGERFDRNVGGARRRRQEREDAESMSSNRERIEGSAAASGRLYGITRRQTMRDLMSPELGENASRAQIDDQLRRRFFSIGVSESETRGVLGGLRNRQAGKGAFGREGTGSELTGDALTQNLEDQKQVQEQLIDLEMRRIDAVRDWAALSKRAVDDQISGLKETLRIEKEKADKAREQIGTTAAAFGRLDPFEQQKAADAFRKWKGGGELNRQEADAMRGIGFGAEADAADAARARQHKAFPDIENELRNRADAADRRVDKIQLDIKTQEEIKMAITVKAESQIQDLARKLKPIIDEIGKNTDKAIIEAFEKFNREIGDRDLSRMPGA